MVKAVSPGQEIDLSDPDSVRVFQHIVRLPMAKVIEEEEEEVTEEETS